MLFRSVFLPLMVPMVLAMAIGPLLAWKRGDLPGVLSRLKLAVALSAAVAAATWVLQGGSAGPWWAAGGMGLATWLFLGTLAEFAERVRLFRSPAQALGRALALPRAAWGMTLAHAGLAIFIAGMTASSAWKEEKVQTMKVGDTVEVSGYAFTLAAVRDVEGPNYLATEGTFEVRTGGELFATVTPEKRTYRQPPRPTTEAAIVGTFLGDVYAVIGDADPQGGGWVTRLYFNPLVPWMWAGALIMVVGGVVSLSDRRHRVGAPTRARGSRPAAAKA